MGTIRRRRVVGANARSAKESHLRRNRSELLESADGHQRCHRRIRSGFRTPVVGTAVHRGRQLQFRVCWTGQNELTEPALKSQAATFGMRLAPTTVGGTRAMA